MISICKTQAYIANTLLVAESCKGGIDRPVDSVVEFGLVRYVLRLHAVALECYTAGKDDGREARESAGNKHAYFSKRVQYQVLTIKRTE